jgi:hypothetical protein
VSNALRWSQQMNHARLQGSESAYTTALGWLRTYPAAEVERRLVEIIAAKRAALKAAES